ncbi:MAG: DUF2062 domain-containing protein [Gammaproteobacteria bacterium]|nr:DUF2062 domain-containing protein [Gammaproteobacteria bacterium]
MSPKQKLRRYFSNRDAILNSRMGGWLGEHLHDPEIWHFGRRAVAGGVGIGFFLAFVPIPMHMLMALLLALVCRVNLPVTVAAVWIANPVTVAPMFIFALKVGGVITHHEVQFSELHFDATWANVSAMFSQLWLPLVVGCLLCGAAAGALGNATVRGLWRLHLLHRLQQRRQRRRERARPDA